MDQRIQKEHKQHIGSDNVVITEDYAYTLDEIRTTFYVLDASGNQMAMYDKVYEKEPLIADHPQTRLLSQ